MGMFKDLRDTTKAAKEIQKNFDPGAMRAASRQRMAGLNESMAAQTAALNSVAADGQPATAQVVSVGQPTSYLNGSPVVPIELLVITPGGAPRPMSTTQMVPVQGMGRLTPGSSLSVTVSASNPDALVINW
jgi:hypothetical protein